jgi:hypothetical protein
VSDRTAYFICPDYDVPSGGVRVIYRHVEHLRDAGIPAAVVHTSPTFRPTWFASDVPVVSTDAVDPTPADLLVIPEIYGPGLATIAPGIPKAVFNQNAYKTFDGYSADPYELTTPYGHPEIVAAVVVSEDNAAYLRHGFPNLTVRRTINAVDPQLFHPQRKRRRIAYMPRKNRDQALQVLRLLAFRGLLDDVELTALDGVAQTRVAALLRETLIFLSFGAPEGFGLPAAEAMAAGCAVVGYHGMGGREFFTDDIAVPVEQGDIVAFAAAVERLLTAPAAEAEALGARASEAIHARYSLQAERDSVVRVWGELLAGGLPASLAVV